MNILENNDVRIGNYVVVPIKKNDDNSKEVVVARLTGVDENYFYYRDKQTNKIKKARQVLPYRISEQTILRFGFQKIDDNEEFDYVFELGSHKIFAAFNDEEDFWVVKYDWVELRTAIKYVHELQNYVFHYTSIELSAKPKN